MASAILGSVKTPGLFIKIWNIVILTLIYRIYLFKGVFFSFILLKRALF
ncbi:hypothetical protein CHISP_0860 [Chitinispirillum alkaliphilum]|nr:hypothetical protein CHISP_0860 [Chitinispirillum alkaliphilum]